MKRNMAGILVGTLLTGAGVSGQWHPVVGGGQVWLPPRPPVAIGCVPAPVVWPGCPPPVVIGCAPVPVPVVAVPAVSLPPMVPARPMVVHRRSPESCWSPNWPVLRAHVEWTLRRASSRGPQRGIVLFVPGTGCLRPLDDVRRTMLEYQNHNGGAWLAIREAPDWALHRVIMEVLPGIEDEVRRHLGWVAFHENRMRDLWHARRRGDAACIRQIYNAEQSHNAEARVLLKAVSDAFLFAVIDELPARVR